MLPRCLAVLLPVTSRGCGDLDALVRRLRGLRASYDSPAPHLHGGGGGGCSDSSTDGDFGAGGGATGIRNRAGGGAGSSDEHPSGRRWASEALRHVCVVLGVDEDDVPLRQCEDVLTSAFAGVRTRLVVFPEAQLRALPQGPLCWMWEQLAVVAVREMGATHFVLLGDDTSVEPPGWPRLVLDAFADATNTAADAVNIAPRLRCLALLDAADPGYPSFPVIDADHLRVFGRLFPPDLFVNQVGDPFLEELYRRLRGLGLAQQVVVTNAMGGIQLPDAAAYVPPRYPRTYPPHTAVLQALEEWTAVGAAVWRVAPAYSVDVLVPAGRANPSHLCRILEGCRAPCPTPQLAAAAEGADVRFGFVVDAADPVALPPPTRAALEALRDEQPGRVRLRFNATNRGASRSRNRMMDESLTQLQVLLDDDVVPQPGMVAAYTAAARANPEARGFAGPTFLPATGCVAAHAVHTSDVAFFWQLPATGLVGARPDGTCYMPWAVTANMAVRNTSERFDARFPRTGGGEDIDFCLRAAPGGLLAVPQAACVHPLWNNGHPGLRRFARWAIGDGQLIEMYPRLTYMAAPNASELLLLLAALAAAAAAVAVLALAAARLQGTGLLAAAGGAGGGGAAAAVAAAAAGRAVRGLVAAGVGLVAAELGLELVRHCCNPARLARHPCPDPYTRLAAAAYAALIRNASEAGRLYGHAARAFGYVRGEDTRVAAGSVPVAGGGVARLLRLLARRFDWFCGLDAAIVRLEQLRAVVRVMVLVATALAAGAAAATGGTSSSGSGGGGGVGGKASWPLTDWIGALLAVSWGVGILVAVWRE